MRLGSMTGRQRRLDAELVRRLRACFAGERWQRLMLRLEKLR